MSATTYMISIHNLDEAKLARDKGAQLIEAIHPNNMQSIMPLGELRQITKHFEDVCPVGAFCGDIPMQTQRWIEAIETLSAAAVDIIILPIRFPGELTTLLQETGHLTDLYPTCALINPFSLPTDISMETVIAAIGGCHWMGICLEINSAIDEPLLTTLHNWINLIHESDLMAGLSVNHYSNTLEQVEADFIRLPLSQFNNV
ncbi:hypothetical protein LHV13_07915 [Ferrovum sp. PN-J185]|uniref:hypothetical protein n=1 Tax=Ferrovum sp. PN-J185 TaxID=1356306 RepID=UPI00079A5DBA|nr:hypothetical protein [Ferrovum sp. PN-J185]KXW56372.1 hypothetical protein FV185_03200 [Ferrovum sp. PN-J185]MCC6069095.1 hypothetical protein [Ferrovum sp. PN-J185]MDE1890924.1 hypothetical protein [Betaproteobacteria bacterium]MDE2055764.1 hypothetical protein [Betaproteobacteria bacterium]